MLRDGRVLAVASDPRAAGAQLLLLDPATHTAAQVPTAPYSSVCGSIGFCVLAVEEDPCSGEITLFTTAGSALLPAVAVAVHAPSADALVGPPGGALGWEVVARSASGPPPDARYLSAPRALEVPTTHGRTAFLNHYPPANADFALPEGGAPPLLVKSHGGPTAQASTAFNPGIQYWTSRGWAVADVNYG